MKTTRTRTAAALLTLALVGAACGGNADPDGTAAPAIAKGPDTAAATLRSELQNILGVHVFLVSSASAATLDGRSPEAAGARAVIAETNTDAFAATLGEPYDDATERRIAALWRRHLRPLTNYVAGVEGNQGARRDSALADLLAYAERFATEMDRITQQNATRAVLLSVMRDHIATLKDLVETQRQQRHEAAVANLTRAYTQIAQLASALSEGVAADKDLEGDPRSQASDQRASLNDVLGRHTALLVKTTGAMAGGRTDERDAAREALTGSNAEEVAAEFTSFGPEVEKRVLTLWRAHIQLFLDYASARGDASAQRAALDKLDRYAEDFGTALNTILPSLEAAEAQRAVLGHVRSVKTVIDAQQGSDPRRQYEAVAEAMRHMDHIALAIAKAIDEQRD